MAYHKGQRFTQWTTIDNEKMDPYGYTGHSCSLVGVVSNRVGIHVEYILDNRASQLEIYPRGWVKFVSHVYVHCPQITCHALGATNS